ncbi:ATP-dependent DNA helicase yku80 [Penicillium rubens]|nr:ATP-dependent DNA helicase yku80 [Penicillium rubens]
MAEKEATVYIVDMGRSMGERHHGRPMTDLEWAMQYVWDRITATVATGRKTATVGVVGLRTDGTINDLEEESFSNISILFGLGQVLMPDIRKLRETIKPSNTNRGDAISSIVIAMQMIIDYTKKNKYKRKIILVTNGTGVMSDDNIEGIIEKMKEVNIELVVIGADFDDAEYGVKEEDKDSRKAENETLLRSLAEDCEGAYGTLEQAVSELDIPRIKVTKSMPSFKGNLTLGNPEEYDTAMTIPVERYFRTYVAKPISASSFVPRSGTEPGSQAPVKGDAEGDALASVRTSRTYQITDESAPGGKIDVERDDLAKGYEYGRTAVPIEQTDENVANLQTFAGMGLIGFVQKDQYDRYMHMSNTNIIIPQRANDYASLALSSLIHALYELESYAVARLVTKESKPPMLVLLAPSIEADYECLIEVQLPFAEDVRSYRFPPLDKIITVSGKVVTEHRNLPSVALKDAMSNYVDSMDFVTTNDEGARQATDDLPIDESFSPLLHRIESAVRYRAVHPNDPVLDPSERLTEFAHPSEDMVKNSKSHLEKLMSIADVKKVPPKTKGRKRQRETEKPLSGLDVDALLSLEPKRTKISTENAIPEFKQTLSRAENIDAIHDAVQQMAKIIESQITHSLGHSNYDRVIEGLGTMREELVDYEEPAVYNDFVRQLKGKMLREELGGDRRELWWFVRKGKLGLIGKSEVDSSAVEEQEAQEFLAPN